MQITFDIFEGVIQGFFSYEKYPDLKVGVLLHERVNSSLTILQACASDIYEIYDDLVQAIGYLKGKDSGSVADGLKLVGEALTEVGTAIKDCKGAEEDIESIIKTLASFKTPMSFAFHVGKDLIVRLSIQKNYPDA